MATEETVKFRKEILELLAALEKRIMTKLEEKFPAKGEDPNPDDDED